MAYEVINTLIYGWRLDREAVLQWMSELKFRSCYGTEKGREQCFCGPRCWGPRREQVKNAVPAGWRIVRVRQECLYGAASDTDVEIYLALDALRAQSHCTSYGTEIGELEAWVRQVDVSDAAELALKLGAANSRLLDGQEVAVPKLYAVTDICH